MTVAFPMMGNYNIPSTYFLSKILETTLIEPPKITNKTMKLGTSNSPDFVCTPFKYTLGTMIECLDSGADTLIQLGGGCRYGYYSELQEEILKKLGYNFQMINLVTKGKINFKHIAKEMSKINPHIKSKKVIYYGLIGTMMLHHMDKIDSYILDNIGFEVKRNSFVNLRAQMYKDYLKVKSIKEMIMLKHKYNKLFSNLLVNKPKDHLKVGIIGELYTNMEPFSNFELETMIAKYHVSVKRYTNVWYLFVKHFFVIKKRMYKNKYIKYNMGAYASDNICETIYLCKHHYDGIIHIKSSFCTPEIADMSIINKICKEYNIPVIYFSFDANTSLVGVKTRIEAFYDMIKMQKENKSFNKT